jgi:hypothetical protein
MGGISASTGNYILYGTNCYLTVNNTDIGSLIGDVSMEMTTEEYYPDLLQALGPLTGTGKIIGATGTVTATLAEWNYTVLAALFHLGSSTDANSQKIGSGAIGTITELTNVVVTGLTRNDLKPFKVTILKARVTSPVATTLSKSEIAGLEVTFESLYTTAAPATFPMFIEISIA